MKKVLTVLGLATTLFIGSNDAFAACGCDCDVDKIPCEKKGCPLERKTFEKFDRANKFDSYKEELREKMRDDLYCKLNLDECQKLQAREIEDRYRPETDSLFDKLKNDKKALCDVLNADCLNKSSVRAQERVVKQDLRDIKCHLKRIDKDFKTILKCEQKSEYRKYKSNGKYIMKKIFKYNLKKCHK